MHNLNSTEHKNEPTNKVKWQKNQIIITNNIKPLCLNFKTLKFKLFSIIELQTFKHFPTHQNSRISKSKIETSNIQSLNLQNFVV